MEKMLQKITLLVVLMMAVDGLVYKDCGSAKAKIDSVSVTDCEKSQVCKLKKGSSYTITVDFTPSEDVAKATTVVHGIVGGIPFPFYIDNPDACKNCGMTCPAPKGKKVTYHTEMKVKTSFPCVKVIVEWEVRDQHNKDLVCISIPAQIVEVKDSDTKVNHIPRKDVLVYNFDQDV